ncbi:MAG: hypothetical protein WEB93_01360 [Sphingomonadales bacterium]
MFRKRRSLNKQDLPSQEEVLHDYARRLRHHKTARRGVHLHLSRLTRANQHPQDINIAASHFDRLIPQFDGQLFRLTNCDIVFVGKGASLTALDEVVLKLRFMFRDDPCLKDLERVQDIDPFCTHYDMERDHDAFLQMAETALDRIRSPSSPPDSGVIAFDPIAPSPVSVDSKPALPPLARFIERRPVFAWSRNNVPTVILSEIYFDVSALRQWAGGGGAGGRVSSDDLWLIRTLAGDLDDAVIGHIFGPDRTIPAAITLPVRAETVLSPDFDTFNTRYRSVSRTPLVFEFGWQAVMRAPEKFLSARDRILEQGHKICVDGWDPYGFALANPSHLNAHFLKVAWRDMLHFEFRADWIAPLAETIRTSGATRVILTDCTSHAGAEFGHKVGLILFQGTCPEERAAEKAP